MHNGGYVVIRIATTLQQHRNLLEISNRIEITRRLLTAKAAIQIRADTGMSAVPG